MGRANIDSEALRKALEPIVGSRLSMRETDLSPYSRDMWPRLLIGIRAGARPPALPHAVVWPRSDREIAAIVRVARSLSVPVVPYGAGSGVCGGAVPLFGGITVDLKQMDSIRSVSRAEMLVDVEAGANGERFERELNHKGYTLGHFPSSIYCSTVGGWLACRAAGQMSTKYGKIEDLVTGLTAITGKGEIVETDGFARASRGPNWTQLLVGSEGTLGIISSARLRVSPAPGARILRGFEFESVDHGVEAMRRVMQRGLRPAVMRLYNELDTFINQMSFLKSGEDTELDRDRFAPIREPGAGALPPVPPRPSSSQPGTMRRLMRLLGAGAASAVGENLRRDGIAFALARPKIMNALTNHLVEGRWRGGCRFIVGLEGSRIRTEVEASLTFRELSAAGGKDTGEGPGLAWLEHRYAVSYGMSGVFRSGAFVDTMEVASTWDRLIDMYDAVRAAISQHALVMAHFSHAYASGCSIYFTFVGQGESPRQAEAVYDAIWRDGLAAATRAGGTISHHHGVGLLKAKYMAGEHREAMSIYEAIKASLDPDGIMNPGKMGLKTRSFQ